MKWSHVLAAIALLLGAGRLGAAQVLPAGVSEIVRQMQEWRDVSSAWLSEATAAYATNGAALRQLRSHYIEASSIANSLIGQFQLETASRTPMDPRRYEPHVKRAKTACEALSQEARRLLLDPAPKTRGSGPTNTAPRTGASTATTAPRGAGSTNTVVDPRLVMEGVERTVGLAGGILDIVSKNRKAFTELDDRQRKEVSILLESAKWTPLNTAPARTPEPRK